MTKKNSEPIRLPKYRFLPFSAYDAKETQVIQIEDWGKTHSDVLMAFYNHINGIGGPGGYLPEFTREDIYKTMEERKTRRAMDTTPVFNFEGEELDIYGEMVLLIEYGEDVYGCQIDIEHLAESVSRFYRIQLLYNGQNIYKLFNNTPIFPIILETIGIMKQLDNYLDNMIYTRHYNYYYKGFKKEDVYDIFGESNEIEERFQPDRKLTENDYKIILEAFCEYLDFVQKSGIKKRLIELSTQIYVFNRYFIEQTNPKDFNSSEAILRLLAKEAGGRPGNQKEYSKPLSQKAWADIFEMSRNKMSELMKGKQYHFKKISDRKWVLPKNELPAEYLEKYRQKQ